MYEVVGFQHKELKFEDGNTCSGYYLFLTEKRDKVSGVATDRVFCSDGKIGEYVPKIGDHIQINYNRYGKVAQVYKC
jgi:hypothetical protein